MKCLIYIYIAQCKLKIWANCKMHLEQKYNIPHKCTCMSMHT
jgi:hypothetical protein